MGGGQISGQQVGLSAIGDIDIIGSTVTATDAIALKAGGNITVASTTREWRDDGDLLVQQTTTLDRVAGLYVTNKDGAGVLSVNAGGNVELRAAQLANAGTNGLTAIVAGGDLNLTAVTERAPLRSPTTRATSPARASSPTSAPPSPVQAMWCCRPATT